MEFDKSRLERLKRSLYSRDESLVPKEKRTPVSEKEYSVKNDWGERSSFDLPNDMISQKNNSFFKKFLIVSVVFFLAALGIASVIFFGGLNTISSNNVDIKITGPSSVSSGEELDLDLSVINQNRADLQNVSLTVEYPSGAQSVEKDGVALSRDKIDLGNLSNGQSVDHSVRFLLSGEKGAVKTIKLHLNYTVAGSNAVFSKDKSYDVSISSSPLILDVSYPKEINSGQDVVLSVTVTSNSSAVVQNAMVKVLYPYGFTYKDSNMASVKNNSVWNLGDLKAGDKKTLTITGTLVGQNMEDRSFQVSVGVPDISTASDFTTSLATQTATVGIRKSFFNLSVYTSGDQSGVAEIGQNVSVTVGWQNTLPDKILNGKVVAKLSGNVFDRTKVSANSNGFYSSSDSSISWDKNMLADLASIFPGDSGQVSFSVSPISNLAQIRAIKNPYITVHVDMTGDRTGTEATSLSSSQDLTVKFISDLEVTAKSYRNEGPFTNTGSIPPRTDRESTYTVVWTLTNTTNDLNGAVVSAVLPAGVVWKGETSPNGEKINYDSDSRTVSWNADTVPAGSGFTYSPKTVSFKVGITPSVTQVGAVLPLLSDTGVSADDTFTETSIKVSAPPVTTHFSDSNFRNGDDTVVK